MARDVRLTWTSAGATRVTVAGMNEEIFENLFSTAMILFEDNLNDKASKFSFLIKIFFVYSNFPLYWKADLLYFSSHLNVSGVRTLSPGSCVTVPRAGPE